MFQLSSFSSFGIGGARRPSSSCAAAAASFLSRLGAAGIAPASVFTSCGSGAPAMARAAFPGCRVFSASDFPGLGRAAYAARAAALVRGLAVAPSPLWVCFPGCAAPASLAPSRRWVPCGSGSWSECSLAAGLGVPVLVFLPGVVVPPSAFGAWASVGSGWWLLPVFGRLF
jgi:hypothetical protein